jgi:hypothetical protein
MTTLSPPQIAQLARNAGFTGTDVVIAVAVALAESGGRTDIVSPRNHNGSIDRGLTQINSIHGDFNWRDPQTNMNKAYQIWREAGRSWKPWSTFNSGSYRKFLSDGLANGGGSTATVQPVGLSDGMDGLKTFGAFISDSHNYVRLGYFAVGLLILIVVLVKLSGAESLVKTAVKVAV